MFSWNVLWSTVLTLTLMPVFFVNALKAVARRPSSARRPTRSIANVTVPAASALRTGAGRALASRRAAGAAGRRAPPHRPRRRRRARASRSGCRPPLGLGEEVDCCRHEILLGLGRLDQIRTRTATRSLNDVKRHVTLARPARDQCQVSGDIRPRCRRLTRHVRIVLGIGGIEAALHRVLDSHAAGQRQKLILDEIRAPGAVRVSELTELLGVSRHDRAARPRRARGSAGLLQKVHGGATRAAAPSADEPGFEAKSHRQLAEKEAIARAAAGSSARARRSRSPRARRPGGSPTRSPTSPA